MYSFMRMQALICCLDGQPYDGRKRYHIQLSTDGPMEINTIRACCPCEEGLLALRLSLHRQVHSHSAELLKQQCYIRLHLNVSGFVYCLVWALALLSQLLVAYIVALNLFAFAMFLH